MQTIAQQPLVVAIAANNRYIHSYARGVIDAEDCTTIVQIDKEKLNTVNHGVLLVGYGTDQATGLDYWLVKNSWNTTWGDQGYFKLKIVTDSNVDIIPCGGAGAGTQDYVYPILD